MKELFQEELDRIVSREHGDKDFYDLDSDEQNRLCALAIIAAREKLSGADDMAYDQERDSRTTEPESIMGIMGSMKGLSKEILEG